MVRELGNLIKAFPGIPNMIRYFDHTVNLGAKSVMKQFDLPKGKEGATLSEAEKGLREMMEGIDLEDPEYDDDDEEDEDSWGAGDVNNAVDEREEMAEEDVEELELSLMPARMVLAKVCIIAVNYQALN